MNCRVPRSGSCACVSYRASISDQINIVRHRICVSGEAGKPASEARARTCNRSRDLTGSRPDPNYHCSSELRTFPSSAHYLGLVADRSEDQFEPPKFPYHAVVVHVPVGAWVFAFIFDLFSWFGAGGNGMVRLSFFAIALGLAVALVAIPTGVLDWGGVKREKPAWKIGLYHMAINLVVTVLFAIGIGVRLVDWRTAEQIDLLSLIISGTGAILTLISAYLGGRMIHQHGVSVARRSKKRWRRIAEKGGAHLPPEKG